MLNPQVAFVSRLNELRLSETDLMMLTYFCHLLINEDDDEICKRQLRNIFNSNSAFNRTMADMRSGKHQLIEKGWVVPCCVQVGATG